MFVRKEDFQILVEQCQRLKVHEMAHDKMCKSIERIKKSKVVFEKTEGIENLYVADELDTKCQLVIYSSRTAIENSITRYLSRNEAESFPGLDIVGFLELERWDENERYIEVAKLFISPKYRRKGYATKVLKRLIECAIFHEVNKIVLTASAGEGIEQKSLEELYQKCGFIKESESENKMIWEL